MARRKYKSLIEEEYFKTNKSRGVVRVLEEDKTKTKIVALGKEIKSKDKWVPKKGKFFGVLFVHIHKIIEILLNFTKKFGWKLPKTEKQIFELKKQLDEQIKQKQEAEKYIRQLEKQIEEYKKNLEVLRKEIIKNNLEDFKNDLKKFEQLINKSESQQVREEEIQQFLKEKPWIFSPEYHNVKPKKPAGSKNKFDFYLEDYKGQGTIVELKLPSDPIFSKKEKYGLSAKCGEALGQLIRYIEITISISNSTKMSKEEEIYESKPLGFLIIGRTKTSEEVENLKTINYYFHKSIQILSYDMLLLRAKKMLEPWLK